jgi:hypothetical protein
MNALLALSLSLTSGQDLSTDSLRFLDTAQSLADVAYFIQHVDIAGVGSIAHRPVVVYGGSCALSSALSVPCR